MADSVSDAEKVQIATGFLLCAPPGEFNEVVTDVAFLVGNAGLLNQHFASTAQEWNTEQMIAADVPNKDYKVLITKFGEVSPTKYLDPRGKQIVTIDHVKQTITSSEAAPAGANEPLRASIDAAMAEYVKDHYKEGTATVYSKDGDIIICISAAKFSPANFWNGRWISTWTVKGAAANASTTVEGTFKLSIHYYEDGNVQLNTETSKSIDVAIGDAASAGAAVKKAIARAENDYQSGIEETYKIMAERSFKGLRRRLPVTRHPMDWDKSVGYSLGKEIGGK